MTLIGPRLRQLVFACETVGKAGDLQFLLGLGDYYPDPGVGEFGLDNAVFSLGDQFIEIVAPQPDKGLTETAAGRFLHRNGAGGYMVLLEVPDIEEARNRADNLDIRRIWNIDLEEISASHLHPSDLGGAILSVDQARPTGSWLWGGPDWQTNSVPGTLTGAVFQSDEPEKMCQTWAQALGLQPVERQINLEGGTLFFEKGPQVKLSSFHIAVPDVDPVLERARTLDLKVDQTCILFEGVTLNLHPM